METGGMATILEFRRTAEPVARAEAPQDGQLGQVIIFPGVRIERRAEGTPNAATPARKRTPRGRKRQRR